MTPRALLIQMGPICGERTSAYNLIASRPLPSPASACSILFVSGFVPAGLERALEIQLERLPLPVRVVALLPCHSTLWFWASIDHGDVHQVLETHAVIEGCPEERPELLTELVEMVGSARPLQTTL